MPELAPIVLFVYNRPDHTRRTLAALAANPLAIHSDLVVYADGPKKQQHESTIHDVRNVVRGASGFKSVTVIERDKNLGLANSIIGGVSEICAAKGRAIVVEDDLIVAPQFLTFLNRGLERYQDEQRVFQISGYMYPVDPGGRVDSLFLPMISCWGWATWQNAWSQFDPLAAGFDRLKQDAQLRSRFDLDGNYNYFGMLTDQMEGRIDSWGVRWFLSVFLQDGLVLYPRKSLVQNAGVDGSGTHGNGIASLQRHLDIAANASQAHDVWPSSISVDSEAFELVKRLLSRSPPHLIARLIKRVFG